MLARSIWPPGKTIVASVIGTIKATCGAPRSAAPTHSPMNGQSLPQSGSAGLAGQHGISSMAMAAVSPFPERISRDTLTSVAAAIAGRATGVNKSPSTATNAQIRPMANRMVINPHTTNQRFSIEPPDQTSVAVPANTLVRRPTTCGRRRKYVYSFHHNRRSSRAYRNKRE